ncbi:MAG TPA: hypothetical protein VGR26_04900 [Acidimicrobiales bacterium]|nr:hypothetical protein [Acidimicrobiales bacterium]
MPLAVDAEPSGSVARGPRDRHIGTASTGTAVPSAAASVRAFLRGGMLCVLPRWGQASLLVIAGVLRLLELAAEKVQWSAYMRVLRVLLLLFILFFIVTAAWLLFFNTVEIRM